MLKISLYIIITIILIYVLYKLYRTYIKMDISKKGMDFIRGLETNGKYYNTMILDSRGLPTIGVGHLIQPNEQYLLTATLTNAQVDALFHKDLQLFVNAANNAITVPVTQNQFDAIISILFNIGKAWGDGIGQEATFIKLIDATASIKSRTSGYMQQIAQAIMKFNQPPEIITRRAKEARLFVSGNYDYASTVDLQQYINMA